MNRITLMALTVTMVGVFASGCAMMPQGAGEEKARAEEAVRSFPQGREERWLPQLPDRPSWRDVLQRALLANGALEAAVHEWQAAMARVDQAAGYPNSNAMVSFQTMFSDERMKTFDRMTFTLGFDTMENLVFPSKTRRAGEAALDAARAAGERARATKFALQERVLGMWIDYALLAEEIRVRREKLELSELLSKTAASRLRSGGLAQESHTADLALMREQNDLSTQESQLHMLRAELNAMLARVPDAALPPPDALPEPRALPATDAQLLGVAVERNPELAALAHEVAGREDALALARMQWIPDVNPMGGLTGSLSKMVGAAVMLPTTFREIRGAIRENEAMLEASRAMLEQTRRERAASFVATLVALRDAERQSQWFEERIIPVAERASEAGRQSYSTGSLSLTETLETEEAALDARFTALQVRAQREKLLARLESLAGVDVETLAAQETVP